MRQWCPKPYGIQCRRSRSRMFPRVQQPFPRYADHTPVQTAHQSRPYAGQGRTSTQIEHQSRLYAGPDCAPIQTSPVRTSTQTAHRSRPYAGPLGDRGVLALHAGGSQRTRPRESVGAKAYARRVTRATAFFTMKMTSSNATESSTMVPPGFRPRTYERMSPSTAEPTPTALEMTQV